MALSNHLPVIVVVLQVVGQLGIENCEKRVAFQLIDEGGGVRKYVTT